MRIIKGKKRQTKKKWSVEELKQRRLERKFLTDIRTTFVNCGFEHIPTRNQQVTIAGITSEFDSVFAYENIIVFVEDTTSNSAGIPDHLRKKCEFYTHLESHRPELFEFLFKTFSKFKSYMHSHSYAPEELRFIYAYCSRQDVEKQYKQRYGDICHFFDYAYLQYFLTLSKTIHRSARFELFKFLKLELKDIGCKRSADNLSTYHGLLLPFPTSGFPTGHRIVSFLADPNMLLEQAYVLRTDGWRGDTYLYQRLLIKSKIKDMRSYLANEKRVYINNIIATLPPETVLKDETGQSIKTSEIDIKPVSIQMPKKFNTIGIIDGQHRVYSYHEGDDNLDKKIKTYREKQHLLVTGIIYPPDYPALKKQKFEAQLFLEINDKQKPVKGDLKQAIERIINPYSAIAVSKAVIAGLASTGPLHGLLEVHFFDVGKIKTTSIVSYGLKHIVALDGEHSLFKTWRRPNKANIKSDRVALDEYVSYCVTEINMFISGFKTALTNDIWSTDQKVSRALTITTINGLIYCIRKLIETKQLGNFEYYKAAFKNLKIDFKPTKFTYKSSHWKDLGDKIFSECFGS
ncbi:MAG: hypothetical protein A2Y07_01335 [Planctomycetes bacterium GWF2_50_10]|nr:MAG: hypothetical protein A2Y07_01335 [Planctomycetes bacterium GWF2_50_10]HAL44848.1 hypothetical protein [Phycisphaerales bacterium]